MAAQRTATDWAKILTFLMLAAAVVWRGGEIRGDISTRLSAIEQAVREQTVAINQMAISDATQGETIEQLRRADAEQREALLHVQRYLWGFAPGDEREH